MESDINEFRFFEFYICKLSVKHFSKIDSTRNLSLAPCHKGKSRI